MPNRITHRERFYSEANANVWLEVEIIDSMTIKGGAKAKYQKIIYTFIRPLPGSRFYHEKTVDIPYKGSMYSVKIPVYDRIFVKSDSKERYQKRIYSWVNGGTLGDDGDTPSGPNDKSRRFRVDTVHSGGDKSSTLDCEVPLEFEVKSGKGFRFQRRFISLDQSKLPGIRDVGNG